MIRAPIPKLLNCLILCLLLTSHGQALADAESDPDALPTVRVQLKWAHQFQFAGYYAALHKGFYQDKGLAVVLIEHSPELNPIDQLLGGRVEFSIADTGALIYRSTGVPLVALAAIYQHSPSILIALERSGIQALTDLRGRRAMLSAGHLNAELMAMLQNAGISSKDFELVPSNTSIRYLIEGHTDAYNGYTTNEPYFLSQQGIPFRIFRPRDYGVDFYGDILLTTEMMIERQPQMVRDFRDATLQGWQYAIDHKEEIVDLILSHYNTQGKTRDHLMFEANELVELILPNVVPVGYMNKERWRHIADVFHRQGLTSDKLDIDDFLYQEQHREPLSAVLWRYRIPLGSGLLVLIGLLLVLHILSLRRTVKERTLQLQHAKQLAEAEARCDALTGLPNRRCFLEHLTNYVNQAKRHATPLSVIMLDLDYFKVINDSFGHAAGDEVLRAVGHLLQKLVRDSDSVARVGGEEFAFACCHADAAATAHFAERIRLAIAQLTVEFEGNPLTLSASLGFATWQAGDTPDQLINKADMALYRAKTAGRNSVQSYQ